MGHHQMGCHGRPGLEVGKNFYDLSKELGLPNQQQKHMRLIA